MALAALGLLAAPAAADAQVRASVFGGALHLPRDGAPSTRFVARAEATFSLIPWLHLGAYGQALPGSANEGTGYGLGGLLAFRPLLPLTPIDPMAYASIGYQRAPSGAALSEGAMFELGGGLVWHAASILDVELRGGYVGFVPREAEHGFTVAAGLSLHP